MIDAIASTLVNTGYLAASLFFGYREARAKRAGMFICYAIGLMCVGTAHEMTEPDWYTLGATGFFQKIAPAMAPALTLGFALLLSMCIFGLLGVLYTTDDKRKAGSSPLLTLAGWYLLSLVLSYTYAFEGLGLHDMVSGAMTHKFSDSLYFVAMTFTTVGYGDLVPATQLGRLFAGLAALNAYAVLALFFSIVIPRLLVAQMTSAERREKLK